MGFFVIERITKNSQELDLYLLDYLVLSLGFPGGSDHKEFACSEGHRGSIPGSGRSPGEGNGNSLQYSWVGNLISYRPWDHKELDTTEQLTNNHCQVLSI